MKKEELKDLMYNNLDQEIRWSSPLEVNDNLWTTADLFIRQFLNNGTDGFGLTNVEKIYNILVDHKENLIEWGWVSASANNNAGHNLWDEYNF